MITIFNRRKLAIVFSMKEVIRLRSILAAAHIEYLVCTVRGEPDAESPVRKAETAWSGYLRNDIYAGPAFSYIFYVRKKDFSDAAALNRRRRLPLCKAHWW